MAVAPPAEQQKKRSPGGDKKKVDARVRALVEHTCANFQRSFFVIVGDRGRDQIVNLHFLAKKVNMDKKLNTDSNSMNALDNSGSKSNKNAMSNKILWCYKKELGFSSNRKVRSKELKKQMAKGEFDANLEDPFELFVASNDIRYCYYKDTEEVLGKTYSMVVLQDFEALTPNLLCRTIETVSGGGLVVLLLKNMASLEQLYRVSMDSHSKFNKNKENLDYEKYALKDREFEPRFNERFLLSLTQCDNCLVVDDELNILPVANNRAIKQTLGEANVEILARKEKADEELVALQKDLKEHGMVGALINQCRTLDQAKAILQFTDIVSDKNLSHTISLTASRGRGKSAALGLSLASAIACGYANIFVTAPSPENLTTVFEFLLKGFDALKYTEHQEYELIQSNLQGSGSIAPGAQGSSSSSSNSNYTYGHGGSKNTGNGNIVRVNVFRRDYRQTIQYIAPEDYQYLSQAELLVIDEAAAIPLPVVKKLLGPYMVIMSSTIHGYEGTGRSLSLKLLADLKKNSVNAGTTKMQTGIPNSLPGQKSSAEQLKLKADMALDPKNLGPEEDGGAEKAPDGTETRKSKKERRKVDIRANSNTSGGGGKSASSSTRMLTTIGLDEPIRYGAGDSIEKWLNDLCCLDASEHVESTDCGFPMPNKCKLHMVNRDALFSYHKATEVFLKKVVGLFVTSHYKNTPDDLLLLADAPAHFIFVLLAPDADESDNESDNGKSVGVPDVLVAIHIAIEGCLVKSAVQSAMRRGLKPQGDLIPWQLAQHYCDSDFANLAGARIVRIATHPTLMRKGYASEAVSQLCRWFDGKLTDFTAIENAGAGASSSSSSSADAGGKKKKDKKDKKLDQTLRARDDLPALLEPVCEMAPPFHLDYIGTCFGLTQTLYDFWNKGGFNSVYLAQRRNLTTGEHSIIMVRPTDDEQARSAQAQAATRIMYSNTWLKAYKKDFKSRFLRLIQNCFRELPSALALSVLDLDFNVDAQKAIADGGDGASANKTDISLGALLEFVTRHDIDRLKRYTQNTSEFGLVLDLIPTLAFLYFSNRLGTVHLSAVQSSILIAVGMQNRTLQDVSNELGVPVTQTMALFNKAMSKIYNGYIQALLQKDVEMGGSSGTSQTGSIAAQVANSAFTAKAVESDANLGGAENTSTKHLESERIAAGRAAVRDLEKFSIPDVSKIVGNSMAGADAEKLVAAGAGTGIVTVKRQREEGEKVDERFDKRTAEKIKKAKKSK